MEPECKVRLEAFEGPLDLLLHLIQKNKLEITDIPIALVTAQYLEYLELMKALDVAVAGEYLVMAATLMHVKSRMLLPQPEPMDPEEDPRLEIVRPLQELLLIREAAATLSERPVLGQDVFVREKPWEDGRPPGAPEAPEPVFEVSLIELMFALRDVLGNQSFPKALEIARAKLSLAERMETLSEELSRRGRLHFFELFPEEDRQMIVVTFLAILQMACLGQVFLLQEGPGGDILVLWRREGEESPGLIQPGPAADAQELEVEADPGVRPVT